MKTSIVMAYCNRLEQTIRTLKSIRKYNSDCEIIIVDDASREEEKLDDLCEIYRFKLLRIEPENKTWVNPCIPFNLGFKLIDPSTTNVVIQNPECFWTTNLIDYIDKNLNNSNYISFPCYSLSVHETLNCWDAIESMECFSELYNNSSFKMGGEGESCWYNNQSNPRAYHFCSSLTLHNLRLMSGFDEAFSQGIGFDDDDFLYRIQHQLKLRVEIPREKYAVLHQFHYKDEQFKNHPNIHNLYNKNATMFNNKLINDKLTQSGNIIKAGTICDEGYDILPEFINGQNNMATFLTSTGIVFTTSRNNIESIYITQAEQP